MSENKGQRACRLLRETADALDQLPGIQRRVLLGNVPIIKAQELRNEADHIERIMVTFQQVTEETDG